MKRITKIEETRYLQRYVLSGGPETTSSILDCFLADIAPVELSSAACQALQQQGFSTSDLVDNASICLRSQLANRVHKTPHHEPLKRISACVLVVIISAFHVAGYPLNAL